MEQNNTSAISANSVPTFSILRGSLANGTKKIAVLSAIRAKTFSILRGSLANGTAAKEAHERQRDASFSILRGSLANGTLSQQLVPPITAASFSILRGSLANGTHPSAYVPLHVMSFQYPPRIVSQWNVSEQLPADTIRFIFQYPPRIVSQWNACGCCNMTWRCSSFSILRGSLANGTCCDAPGRAANGALSVSSADR